MKKILITTGIFWPEIGGPAAYGRILARGLSDNFSVTVLTYSPTRRAPEDRGEPFRVVRVWKKIPKIARHLIFFYKSVSIARRADIVLALNAVSAGLPGLLAARIYGRKFVFKAPGDYAWEMAAQKGRTHLLIDDFQKAKKSGWIWLLCGIQSWVSKKADLVIAPSNYLAGLINGWGVPIQKIKVIYNGVASDASGTGFDGLSREEARVKIGIAGNIVLSAGRLVSWKGFRMLIKIMPQLLEINNFFRLVIVGDGPEFKNLRAMAKNLGLEKKVFLVGRKTREELKNYLAAAEIFVLNSGYEGFSHQILEAMAAGVPIISTNAGGNPELIKQGENGFMVRYNDEFNLIEAVKTVWQNPELRNNFVEQGKKAALDFNAEKMLEETIQAISHKP